MSDGRKGWIWAQMFSVLDTCNLGYLLLHDGFCLNSSKGTRHFPEPTRTMFSISLGLSYSTNMGTFLDVGQETWL